MKMFNLLYIFTSVVRISVQAFKYGQLDCVSYV